MSARTCSMGRSDVRDRATVDGRPKDDEQPAVDGRQTRDRAQLEFERFDRGVNSLNAQLRSWESVIGAPRDSRGLTIADDMQSYVRTADDRARLAAVRAAVEKLLDDEAARGALAALEPGVKQLHEIAARYEQVHRYWALRPAHDFLTQAWAKVVKANGLSNIQSAQMQQLQKRLDADVTESNFADAVNNDLPALQSLYNQAFTEARIASNDNLAEDPIRRRGAKPCAAVADRASTSTATAVRRPPRIDIARSAQTDNYYPQWERRMNIEGVVTVRAELTSTGCVTGEQIAKSSDSIMLDQAALEWTTNGAAFTPATEDGAAMAAATMFKVRFKLSD